MGGLERSLTQEALQTLRTLIAVTVKFENQSPRSRTFDELLTSVKGILSRVSADGFILADTLEMLTEAHSKNHQQGGSM